MLGKQSLRGHTVADEVSRKEILVFAVQVRPQPGYLAGGSSEEGLAPRPQRVGDLAISVSDVTLRVLRAAKGIASIDGVGSGMPDGSGVVNGAERYTALGHGIARKQVAQAARRALGVERAFFRPSGIARERLCAPDGIHGGAHTVALATPYALFGIYVRHFSAAALYSVACNLGNVLKIVTNSINNSIVPWMYEKLGQGEYEKLGKTTTAVIVIPVIPVLMLIAVGPEIIWLFGGDKYAAAQYVIPPIAEALVFSFTYTVFTNIEFFFDKNKFVMFASIVASVLNVALNYLLIGPFGYVAAAYTTLLCYALMAAAHYIYVRRLFAQKKIKCPFSGMVLVGMALLLVGLGFVLTLLYPYAIARLIFFTVCLVALFIFRNKITTLLKSVKKKR